MFGDKLAMVTQGAGKALSNVDINQLGGDVISFIQNKNLGAAGQLLAEGQLSEQGYLASTLITSLSTCFQSVVDGQTKVQVMAMGLVQYVQESLRMADEQHYQVNREKLNILKRMTDQMSEMNSQVADAAQKMCSMSSMDEGELERYQERRKRAEVWLEKYDQNIEAFHNSEGVAAEKFERAAATALAQYNKLQQEADAYEAQCKESKIKRFEGSRQLYSDIIKNQAPQIEAAARVASEMFKGNEEYYRQCANIYQAMLDKTAYIVEVVAKANTSTLQMIVDKGSSALGTIFDRFAGPNTPLAITAGEQQAPTPALATATTAGEQQAPATSSSSSSDDTTVPSREAGYVSSILESNIVLKDGIILTDAEKEDLKPLLIQALSQRENFKSINSQKIRLVVFDKIVEEIACYKSFAEVSQQISGIIDDSCVQAGVVSKTTTSSLSK